MKYDTHLAVSMIHFRTASLFCAIKLRSAAAAADWSCEAAESLLPVDAAAALLLERRLVSAKLSSCEVVVVCC